MTSYREPFVARYHSTHFGHVVPEEQHELVRAWVLDRIDRNFGDVLLALPRDSAVLDLPCGIGFLTEYLLVHHFTRVAAVDLSDEQLAVARQAMARRGLGGATFARDDAFAYLRAHRDLDVIAALDFLEHLSKAEVLEFLRLARASLREGGRLLIRTSNAEDPLFGRRFYADFTHETPFTRSSLRQCLGVADLRIERIDFEIVPPFPGPPALVPFIAAARRRARGVALKVLAKVLDADPRAFTEDLVAVAVR